MPGIPGQIIGELGELGKQVGGEIAKIPQDIAGQALETLGTSSGKKPGQQQAAALTPGESAKGENGPWQQIDTLTDERAKKAIAREALAQLVARNKPREPTAREKAEMEEKQKKEMQEKQNAAAAMASVPQISTKPKRGNLHGIGAKRHGSELGKNVRQD